MIQSIHIKNFRSILDETIDFSFAEGKAPNGHEAMRRIPFLQKQGEKFRAVPLLAFFGANAAGKSNLLRAVDAFRRRAIDQVPENYPFYQPDKLHGPLRPTSMDITFFAGGMNLRYVLEDDRFAIHREELEADGKRVFSIRGPDADLAPLATDAYPLDHLKQYLRVECLPTPDGFYSRPFLAVLGRNYAGLDARVKAAYDFFKDGLVPSATDKLDMGHFSIDIRQLAETRKTDEQAVLADIAALVRKLDVPIAALSIVRSKGPIPAPPPDATPSYQRWFVRKDEAGQQVNLHLQTLHRDEEGREISFRLNEEESDGTQNLVFLLARMLLALERGSTVFVDELDRSLHPLLVRSLLNLFVDRTLNPNGARLVFTTHCTDLLDNSILRLSEVAIVSNGLRTGTRVRRLTDLKKEGVPLRNVTDFRKNYLDGFYAGVPFPTL